ncbi:hypothetical protein NST41_20145 [Paenibacillus sp. FSL L8-0696]|nr:hypothetical protein [Paenibacillus odorifer]
MMKWLLGQPFLLFAGFHYFCMYKDNYRTQMTLNAVLFQIWDANGPHSH